MAVDISVAIIVGFGLLVSLIIAVAIFFRKKLKDWDFRMSENLRQLFHGQQQGATDLSYYPSASLDLSQLSPDDHTLQKKVFVCSAPALDDALRGICFLKALSENKTSNPYDPKVENDKPKPK